MRYSANGVGVMRCVCGLRSWTALEASGAGSSAIVSASAEASRAGRGRFGVERVEMRVRLMR